VNKQPVRRPAPKAEPKVEPKKENKAVGIITWVIVLLAFAVVLFTVISLRNGGTANRSLLGFRADVVLSDSMSATDFSAGDLIVTKWVSDPSTLKDGDIISFISQNSDSYGKVVTHKIRAKTTDHYGNPAFITYGTTTDVDDEAPVPYSAIVGKYTFKIAGVGRFIEFLKTPTGYVVIVLIPFLIIIGVQAVRIFKQYREFKRAEERARAAYRKKMMRQRAENERMRAELARMKAEQQSNMQN